METPAPTPSKHPSLSELTAGVDLGQGATFIRDDPLPYCGECGSVIGDVTLHTRWHAGGATADETENVLVFLDSIDPDELEQHMAAASLTTTTGRAAIDALKRLANETAQRQ